MPQRCRWPGEQADQIAYHDREWGVPLRDESSLFEALTLEAAQAGLSWHTILIRRDGYRRAFRNWDVDAIAAIDAAGLDALVLDTGIIRHRGKIEATIGNARATLTLRAQGITLAEIVWAYAEPVDAPNRDIPSRSAPSRNRSRDISRDMSRELKRRGFRFVGPTTCYAFMQAVGIVNDHEPSCFRFDEIARLRDKLLSELSELSERSQS